MLQNASSRRSRIPPDQWLMNSGSQKIFFQKKIWENVFQILNFRHASSAPPPQWTISLNTLKMLRSARGELYMKKSGHPKIPDLEKVFNEIWKYRRWFFVLLEIMLGTTRFFEFFLKKIDGTPEMQISFFGETLSL